MVKKININLKGYFTQDGIKVDTFTVVTSPYKDEQPMNIRTPFPT
jgi:hypothetical protein